jgi:SNF2 family DNA or RNA helicase
MLISKRKKALIMRLRDPARVTTVIPSAKVFTYDNKEYVAVKHGPEETKVLRNIGIEAPSPILHHYQWPGRFAPFDAQREAAAFLSLESRAFNLSDLGTGKTLATLWAYDYLRDLGLVKKALVITPLSTLERTWVDEAFNHFPHLETAVLHGSRDRRLALLESDADLYLINHDGIKVSGFVEALKGRNDIDLVIVDEVAQVARNAGTDRFRALHDICNKQVPRKVWGMTGTPTPNNPTDAWAQCRLVVPERVPPYFNRFKNQVMRQINQFLWVPRANATEVVHEAMQPAIRFTRDECVDLPPCMYETRTAELSKEQKTAYKDMMNTLRIEAANGDITAANEAVKAQKLIQIACGVVYGANREEAVLDAGPRLEVLMEVVEQAGAKVIVFVPFVSVVPRLIDHLHKAGYTAEAIHGGVSKNERDRIFGAFMKARDPHVLVAQPAAMSHGLTLTSANTIVWYAPISSNDTFEQANARITRPGQKHSQLIVMIEGTDMERRYYQRLKEKQKVQGLLLDMVQNSRLEV